MWPRFAQIFETKSQILEIMHVLNNSGVTQNAEEKLRSMFPTELFY